MLAEIFILRLETLRRLPGAADTTATSDVRFVPIRLVSVTLPCERKPAPATA
jgi:hypothetical protein